MVDVLVVGGGALGLTTAIELAASGRSVRVIDALDFRQGTSHGNAGVLCPSYVTPIASPKVLFTALAWLMRGEGPLTLSRPPWNADMARWLARFLRACASRQGRATQRLVELANRSIEWYGTFSRDAPDFGLDRKGWLYVYNTARGFDEGQRHARAMALFGVESRVLSAREAVDLEPGLRPPFGGIHYPGDAHLDPHAFIAAAAMRAQAAGVELLPSCRVSAIVSQASEVRVFTGEGDMAAANVVLAAGASTARLARHLGYTLPILPARGHSVSLRCDDTPRMPLLFAEAHLVLTPMPGRLRMTSGLELGSSDSRPDAAQLQAMVRGAGDYLAAGDLGYTDPWVGFRPLTPDGLPIVGRLSRHPAVIVASGHGTLGMTLAPATAQIVRAILEGQNEPALLSPSRFGRGFGAANLSECDRTAHFM